jgi:hypothetical protein
MSDNFEKYTREYADAAGLRVTDMPSSHHPLLESNDEVRDLADLIDVRENQSQDPLNAHDLGADDPNLDIQEALTLPHKRSVGTSASRTPTLAGFDADARMSTDADDADDESYRTRADFEEEMEASDPDPNAGMDRNDFIGDSGLDRAPDMTGTVEGIARGMATHLPQDLGAGGFQIMEAEDLRTLSSDEGDEDSDAMDSANNGDVIPTRTPVIETSDDALDAVRRLR